MGCNVWQACVCVRVHVWKGATGRAEGAIKDLAPLDVLLWR